MIFYSLPHRWSDFLNFRVWVVFSVWMPHTLGYSVKAHFPLRFIVDPVGICCAFIQLDHLRRWLVAHAYSPLSTFHSTKWWFSLLKVPTFPHHDRIWGPKIASFMRSLIFVDICFPYGRVIN